MTVGTDHDFCAALLGEHSKLVVHIHPITLRINL